MNISELFAAWEEDSIFDREYLSEESIKIPQLHSKWMKFLATERMKHKAAAQAYKVLYRDKHSYYSGTLDKETLDQHGWEPFELRVIRGDLSMYLDSDPDLGELQTKSDVAQEKVKFIEGVIGQINVRGFQIKNVIDWEKFKAGLNG